MTEGGNLALTLMEGAMFETLPLIFQLLTFKMVVSNAAMDSQFILWQRLP